MRQGQKRDNARALRRDMTDVEQRLWRLLRNRRFGGVKFRRQVPIHRTTPLAARRAADDYWTRWCEAAALKPDTLRLVREADQAEPAPALAAPKRRPRSPTA